MSTQPTDPLPLKERRRVFANAAFTLVAEELQRNPGNEDEALKNVVETSAPMKSGFGSKPAKRHTKTSLKSLVRDKCKNQLRIPLSTFVRDGLDAVAVEYREKFTSDLAKFKAHQGRPKARKGQPKVAQVATEVPHVKTNVTPSDAAGNSVNGAMDPRSSPKSVGNDLARANESLAEDPAGTETSSKPQGIFASDLPFERCIWLNSHQASSSVATITARLRSDVSLWCSELDGRTMTAILGAHNNPDPPPALEALYKIVFGDAWRDKFIQIAPLASDFTVLEALVGAAIFTYVFLEDMEKSEIALQILPGHDWPLFADHIYRQLPSHLLEYLLNAATMEKLQQLGSTTFVQKASAISAIVCAALRSHTECFDLPGSTGPDHSATIERWVTDLLLMAIQVHARMTLAKEEFRFFWQPDQPPEDYLFSRFPGLKAVDPEGKTEVLLDPLIARSQLNENYESRHLRRYPWLD